VIICRVNIVFFGVFHTEISFLNLISFKKKQGFIKHRNAYEPKRKKAPIGLHYFYFKQCIADTRLLKISL